jgi:hypothetical protein
MTYPLALRQLAVEKVRQKEMTQAKAAKFFNMLPYNNAERFIGLVDKAE